MGRIALWSTLTGALLLSSMCSTTTTSPSAESVKVTDAEIEDRIKANLNAHTELRNASLGVDADAAENKVTLSGKVHSQSLRSQAVEIAKAAHPGLTVNDNIDVRPDEVALKDYTESMANEARERARESGSKLGDSIEDAWIHTKLVAKLVASEDASARKINVDVVKNVVTLRGAVETAEARREAVRIAQSTDGVRRVNNLLTIEAASR